MAEKYFRVLHNVEINEKQHHPGDELPESAFRPASGNMIDVWEDDPRFEKDWTAPRQIITGRVPEPSELESLLSTGHIEEIV